MWVRLSVAFSLVMLFAAFLPVLGLIVFSNQAVTTYRYALPKEALIPPETMPPLGVVEMRGGVFPLEGFLVFIASVNLLIGTIAGIWVSRSISKPATRLVDAVQAISKQNLSYRVNEEGSQELVDLARAINQMANDLEHADQARRNLLADITHELRTPLTILQGNLRAILDGVYQADKQEVQSLSNQADLLGRLINDLHLLALAEAGQLPNAPQELELGELARQIVYSFTAITEENGIQLILKADGEDFIIKIDPRHIQQILHNLLSNAIKHTPSGGSITVNLEHEESGILLSVADTGQGISQDELPHIFDRFYRKEKTRRGDSGGSGLGLTITKKIVEELHGTIEVRSEIGKGSTFTVHLPIPSMEIGP